MQLSLENVRRALALKNFDVQAAHSKMMPVPRKTRRPPDMPGRVRLGGVLVLLYCREGQLHLVLTKRRDDLQSHAGQVSFPGGRHEPPESLSETALRETHEEVGVNPTSLTLIGELTPLYIFPSDFEVHPFVAWHANGARPGFTPNSNEVAQIIETPLARFFDPAVRMEETWTIRGYRLQVPFFDIQGHKVWGATAMMLSEFLERLRAVQDTAAR